ncbi:MAG: IPT/TIG domain-containing protein [Solirubrobacteraceae bacterium]
MAGAQRGSAVPFAVVAALLAIALLLLPGVATANWSHISTVRSSTMPFYACSRGGSGLACEHIVDPPIKRLVRGPVRAGAITAGAGAELSPALFGTGVGGGYSPADLRSAYELPSESAGTGQTVAIVDAYDDPNAEADLATYRSEYSLGECTTADGCFRKVNQKGGSSYPKASESWSGEISLDLDMVSAVCPKCHLLLVEGETNSRENLAAAENEAVALGATEVSNSFGGEGLTSRYASSYDHPGVPITAAGGDEGYGAEFPSDTSNVIAVGGTTLRPSSDARGWEETVWSGTGSGCSEEPKPAWQSDFDCQYRTANDVSAVADPNTPVSTYDSYEHETGWRNIGGTSVATPIVAGAMALANSYTKSLPGAEALYLEAQQRGSAAFNDVVSGHNGSCGDYLCEAGPGYDGPTGLGTLRGAPEATPPGPATTLAASTVRQTTATLNATVNPEGEQVTECRFEYGTSEGYGASVPCGQSPGEGESPVAVSASVTELAADTTYHYRIVAVNAQGASYGADRSFATLPPLSLSSPSASPITQTGATLNATVDPNGEEVTECRFEYGSSESYGASVPCSHSPGAADNPVAVSATVTGLTAGTPYHFRIAVTATGVTRYGGDRSFTTTASAGTTVFNYTGGEQSLVVPGAVSRLRVFAVAGSGGSAGRPGGAAAQVGGEVHVSPGQTLYVEVGGNGAGEGSGGEGGFNGGGGGGGGGGGASDIRTSPRASGLAPDDRLLVAGGGGGGGDTGENNGGAGGGAGQAGEASGGGLTGGGAGTQSSGGTAGGGGCSSGEPGALGSGGAGGTCDFRGGGGGGGYYGGGGGGGGSANGGGGGGGGSSLVPAGGTVSLASPSAEPQVQVSDSEGSSAPTAVTQPASSIAQTRATLNATVDPNGANVTECKFEYGRTEAYGSSSPCSALPGSGETPVAVSTSLSGLSPNTTYHFRIVAANADGSGQGSDGTFTTSPEAPTVLTGAATSIGVSSATLKATVDPNGTEVAECKFEYGRTDAYGSSSPCSALPGSGETTVAVSTSLSGLSPNTTYHFRIVAANADGSRQGSDGTFTTLAQAPTVATGSASSITETSASLNATVNPNGAEVTECKLEYGTTLSYGSSVPCSPAPESGESPVAVAGVASGLAPYTNYFFRIFAANAGGSSYGGWGTFRTLAGPPTVLTETASATAEGTATLTGTLDANGQFLTSCGFTYTAIEPGISGGGDIVQCSPWPVGYSERVAVSGSVSELFPGLTYTYELEVGAEGTKFAGGQQTFTVPPAPSGPVPTVTKLSIKKAPAAGGSSVTMTGTNFTGATAVWFGTVRASTFTVNSDTSLTAQTPAATSGLTQVRVTTPSGGTSYVSAKARFTFEAPTITSVSPDTGPTAGGTTVTVTGTGFGFGRQNSSHITIFEFGKVYGAESRCVSSTTCTVSSPAASKGKAGTVDVTASAGGDTSKKSRPADQFIYTAE